MAMTEKFVRICLSFGCKKYRYEKVEGVPKASNLIKRLKWVTTDYDRDRGGEASFEGDRMSSGLSLTYT